MLIEIIKGLVWALFTVRLKKSFNNLLVFTTWLLAFFLLAVSVPHSVEVISIYERGDQASKELKSILLAVVIEVIAALILLTALHNKDLSHKQRKWLIGLASPFVFLTLHLQLSYYSGAKTIEIYPLELAAVLPYGVAVCAISIAFLWPLLASDKVQVKQLEVTDNRLDALQTVYDNALVELVNQVSSLQTSLQIQAELNKTALAEQQQNFEAKLNSMVELLTKKKEKVEIQPKPAQEFKPASELIQFHKIDPSEYARIKQKIITGEAMPKEATALGISRNTVNSWRSQYLRSLESNKVVNE